MALSAKTLVDEVWAMNEEAVPRPNGQLTGLRWYHGHINPTASPTGKDGTESAWATGLGRSLAGRYPIVDAQQRLYPGSTLKSDLYVEDEVGCRWWIEIKGAWKWYVMAGRPRKNPNYGKWLVAAQQDCAKLCQIRPPAATHLALILIGFTVREYPLKDDLESLQNGICKAIPSWEMHPDAGHAERVYSWDDRFLASVTVWHRPLIPH